MADLLTPPASRKRPSSTSDVPTFSPTFPPLSRKRRFAPETSWTLGNDAQSDTYRPSNALDAPVTVDEADDASEYAEGLVADAKKNGTASQIVVLAADKALKLAKLVRGDGSDAVKQRAQKIYDDAQELSSRPGGKRSKTKKSRKRTKRAGRRRGTKRK